MACLFGHKWDGCKCSKCGKVRDEGHNWNGCKCNSCGQTRNEQHNFSKTPNKCEKTCSICNEIRESHDLDGSKCISCGKIVWFTDNEWSIIRPLQMLIFLEAKERTGTGDSSFIDLVCNFGTKDEQATAKDAASIIKTVGIFKEAICDNNQQANVFFGNVHVQERVQICNNLLERYKGFMNEV
ncbi:MAG: hypothetical protein FWG87_11785 [Defluviitaleaceae bacterium]|nr:hypothetical protein [Defluviitaleaceae bacterium]